MMAEMTARPLADFSPDWEPLQQTLQPQPPVNQVELLGRVQRTDNSTLSGWREPRKTAGGRRILQFQR